MTDQEDTFSRAPAVILGERRRRVDPARAAAPFTAQLLGAGGLRRGLKGGPPVLGAARSTYLETEYSGQANRRIPVGNLAARRV